MKGVSLAIETIIYIILAVLALSILILFFTTVGGDSQQTIKDEARRSVLCGEYKTFSPGCGDPAGFDEKDELQSVCNKLKAKDCNSPTKECFQNCCNILCPKLP